MAVLKKILAVVFIGIVYQGFFSLSFLMTQMCWGIKGPGAAGSIFTTNTGISFELFCYRPDIHEEFHALWLHRVISMEAEGNQKIWKTLGKHG